VNLKFANSAAASIVAVAVYQSGVWYDSVCSRFVGINVTQRYRVPQSRFSLLGMNEEVYEMCE